MSKILFITRNSERCGVADYGRRLFAILKTHMDITLCETSGEIDYSGYDVALYNYHYATLPFVKKEIIRQVALFHEAFLNFEPDQLINVSELPRPLFNYEPQETNNEVPVIGSFGFGFPDKDFPRIAQIVKDEFNEAVIRLSIPFAEYGDSSGDMALEEVKKCREILENTNIRLDVSHSFLSQSEMLHWLSKNDINLFLYKESYGRGLSSTIDYALSVKRPIGISKSEMFRHLPKEIIVDNTSIKELIRKGIDPLKKVYEENSNERLVNKIRELVNG
jgi:hypothetical protein